MKCHFFRFLLFLPFSGTFAQPVPAPTQAVPILISGATIHVGNGDVLEGKSIAVVDGKIVMNPDASAIEKRSGVPCKIVNARGKHIYPGFIAPFSLLGMVEVDAVRATQDFNETGILNPNARAIAAYNTDSEVTPTVRNNGVLMAQIVPSGGLISGQSSVVQLDAWNWEDAAYRMDEGLVLNWPNQYSNTGWWAEPGEIKREERYKENVQSIGRLFDEAAAYARKASPEIRNLRLEAMKGLFDGSKNLYIRASLAKPIMEAVLFAKKYGINPIIVGAEDAWRITDFLKENKTRLVLHRIQSLPLRGDDNLDQPYQQARQLSEAGIPFCFSMDGAWQQRNLPFQAGQAVAYGLPYEKAVQALTLDAARILGIAQNCGSIEADKDATLFICSGDALDMKSNQVEYALIKGREIVLDDKQLGLYRRFNEKYRQGKK